MKHRERKAASRPKQTMLAVSTNVSAGNRDELVDTVTKAFLSADIPLKKLNHPEIKGLFGFLGHSAPSESSCRAKVFSLATSELERLIDLFVGKDVFMVVDESEVSDKKFVNDSNGDVQHPSKVYLIACKVWNTCMNQQAIIHIVYDVMKTLGCDRSRFVLLLSDIARYMTAAGKVLKNLFPRLFHVTCLAHLIHNCAERVRHTYSNIDGLIATVKAAVVKNKDKKELFVAIGYPPEPVITRWITWLRAAFYYTEHLPTLQEIVTSFDGDGLLVKREKLAVSESSLAADVLVVKRDYESLVGLLEKSESPDYSIVDAYSDLQILNLGSDSANIQEYLDKRIRANENMLSIMKLSRSDIPPALYADLQRCQATSVSVERSFSMLKKLLDKDRNFKHDNKEKYFMMLFNSRE